MPSDGLLIEPAHPSASPSEERTVVFVDGSNWHHSLERIGIRSSALNHWKVAERLVEGRDLREVRYYVGAVAENLTRVREQRRFLVSLRAQRVTVFLGRIQRERMGPQARDERARLRHAFAGREQEVPRDLYETLRTYWNSAPPVFREKGVDTRLSVDLVDLAHRDEYDTAYLISADADFVPAIEIAHRLDKTVFAANPRPGYGLTKTVDKYLKLTRDWFDGLYL